MKRRRKAEPLIDAVVRDEALPHGTLDDPADADALRAAIELRASRVGADLPSAEAIDAIRRKVLADDVTDARHPNTLSRRMLLAVAGGAVAAGAAGVTIDRALFPGSTAPRQVAAHELVPDDGEWVPVATTEQLAGGATQRFAAAKVVGFVSEQDGAPLAVSGACTHLGCLLQANSAGGRLDCPCHRTAFAPDGKVVFSQLETQPPPLPRIKTRVTNGNVEAFLPKET